MFSTTRNTIKAIFGIIRILRNIKEEMDDAKRANYNTLFKLEDRVVKLETLHIATDNQAQFSQLRGKIIELIDERRKLNDRCATLLEEKIGLAEEIDAKAEIIEEISQELVDMDKKFKIEEKTTSTLKENASILKERVLTLEERDRAQVAIINTLSYHVKYLVTTMQLMATSIKSNPNGENTGAVAVAMAEVAASYIDKTNPLKDSNLKEEKATNENKD